MTDQFDEDARARREKTTEVERTVGAIRAAGTDEEALELEAAALEQTDNSPRPGDGEQPEQEPS